jgi:hypothetical protein
MLQLDVVRKDFTLLGLYKKIRGHICLQRHCWIVTCSSTQTQKGDRRPQSMKSSMLLLLRVQFANERFGSSPREGRLGHIPFHVMEQLLVVGDVLNGR